MLPRMCNNSVFEAATISKVSQLWQYFPGASILTCAGRFYLCRMCLQRRCWTGTSDESSDLKRWFCSSSPYWPHHVMQKCISVIYGRRWQRSECAGTQSDPGHHCPHTELFNLDTTKCMNGEQRSGKYFAYAICILCAWSEAFFCLIQSI